MTLTIDLTPTEQERVTNAARRKGMNPVDYIKRLVIEHTPPVIHDASAASETMSVEEKIRAMDAFAETNRNLPVLPDEAFNRDDNLYREELADVAPTIRQERDPELVARVRAVRGKYAHTATLSGSEELHRERQRDREKEEEKIRGYQP